MHFNTKPDNKFNLSVKDLDGWSDVLHYECKYWIEYTSKKSHCQLAHCDNPESILRHKNKKTKDDIYIMLYPGTGNILIDSHYGYEHVWTVPKINNTLIHLGIHSNRIHVIESPNIHMAILSVFELYNSHCSGNTPKGSLLNWKAVLNYLGQALNYGS
jgi:hypothetical protein